MKKTYSLLTTVIFCVYFGGITLLSLLLPDRSFSEMENRNLRPLPELTRSRICSGRFMTEAEEYVSDQIAFRDGWAGLKALSERLTGKQELGGIYLGAEDHLIRRTPEPDRSVLEENIAHVNTFAENARVPVYFGLIPSAASVWQEKLPSGAPTADEAGWTQSLYDSSLARCIPIGDSLRAHKDEPIYYCTDHHWTSLGAFYGANAILEAMGLAPLDLAAYPPRTLSDSFYGTNYSAACAWWTAPDTITAYVPEAGKTVTSNFTGREEPGRLYAEEYLQKKNKYACFLGGNQPLCVIRSQNAGGNLLLIRDSYADCLSPFLSERFSQVHLFDLRYNRMDIHDYIESNGIDAVLVLYSFPNFAEDENLFLLSR